MPSRRLDSIRTLAQNSAAADPAHDFSHSERVLANALAIARTEGGDPEVLAAAAYLHDIANLPKNHPDSRLSSERSAERAESILREQGFGDTQVAAARDAILCHSYSRGLTPSTLEGRVFQDADRLDALGAVGIARTFATGGSMNRSLASSLEHFEDKLFRLEGMMQTETGRRLAGERTRLMRQFVSAYKAETLTNDDKPDAPA